MEFAMIATPIWEPLGWLAKFAHLKRSQRLHLSSAIGMRLGFKIARRLITVAGSERKSLKRRGFQ